MKYINSNHILYETPPPPPPCVRFDPDFVCNNSDKRGRYSYQAQPSMCRWNLARLAEALDSELDAAEAGAVLDQFMPTYEAFYLCIMRKKLGLVGKEEPEDSELISDLLRLMHNTGTKTDNLKAPYYAHIHIHTCILGFCYNMFTCFNVHQISH